LPYDNTGGHNLQPVSVLIFFPFLEDFFVFLKITDTARISPISQIAGD
jgi:hypothetical protein